MTALVCLYPPLNDEGLSTSKFSSMDDGGSELRIPFQGRVELAVHLSQLPLPHCFPWHGLQKGCWAGPPGAQPQAFSGVQPWEDEALLWLQRVKWWGLLLHPVTDVMATHFITTSLPSSGERPLPTPPHPHPSHPVGSLGMNGSWLFKPVMFGLIGCRRSPPGP